MVALAGTLLQGVALAASLEATITGSDGHALEHAVISLLDGTPRSAPAGTRATMDQRARQFAPVVVPIQSGTEVSFPNSDDVRHHVYSFSRSNAFEIRLYHGEASEPIRFERSGIAVLGCNIHDSMVGYLAIVDTPLFAQSSAAGKARIEDVAPGRYTLQLWY